MSAAVMIARQQLIPSQTRAAKGFGILSIFFILLLLPLRWVAKKEGDLHPRPPESGISAREQLRRRGSF